MTRCESSEKSGAAWVDANFGSEDLIDKTLLPYYDMSYVIKSPEDLLPLAADSDIVLPRTE